MGCPILDYSIRPPIEDCFPLPCIDGVFLDEPQPLKFRAQSLRAGSTGNHHQHLARAAIQVWLPKPGDAHSARSSLGERQRVYYCKPYNLGLKFCCLQPVSGFSGKITFFASLNLYIFMFISTIFSIPLKSCLSTFLVCLLRANWSNFFPFYKIL